MSREQAVRITIDMTVTPEQIQHIERAGLYIDKSGSALRVRIGNDLISRDRSSVKIENVSAGNHGDGKTQ